MHSVILRLASFPQTGLQALITMAPTLSKIDEIKSHIFDYVIVGTIVLPYTCSWIFTGHLLDVQEVV